MTPSEMRAQYRELIASDGETVRLRRGSTDYEVRARVTGFTPEEIAAGINQGSRRIIALAEDVEASGFPLPIRSGSDAVMIRSGAQRLTINDVDDSTRRVGGVLIAYVIQATG
jgi:hypothetical protein